MNRIDTIRDLLGDDSAELIATDLQSTYTELQIAYANGDVGIFSHDLAEEQAEILRYVDAVRIVHSWYSTDPIEDIDYHAC